MSDDHVRDEGPPDLSPREAVDRFLQKRSVDRSDSTISAYHYRLKLFVEWCEAEGIASMRDLTGWDLESFEAHRRGKGIQPITLQNELGTLQLLIEYCERIEVVPEGLAERIDVPILEKSQETSDVRLDPDNALALIDHYRSDPEDYGTRTHVILELSWYTGARMGAVRGLDLRDIDLDDQALRFVHRPETDTPLKNGLNGERPVALPDSVCETLRRYIDYHRIQEGDRYGRQPLLTSDVGRPVKTTFRNWMYFATVPCHAGPCPHDKNPETCEWYGYNEAHKCPSSRSPHRVRTGAITWMLNRGLPKEVVAERVNASIEVIDRHYDKEEPFEELEQRRRRYVRLLEDDDENSYQKSGNSTDSTDQ